MSPTRIRTRVLSEKVQRFTIWDNYARHVEELKRIGASDADLAPLNAAAKLVEAQEQADAREKGQNPALEGKSLAEITAPHVCANGWVIRPPTRIAKRWAVSALLKVTGGAEPDEPMGTAYSILAALWALKMWGDGQRDRVMQVIMGPGALAELLPDIEDESGQADLQTLLDDYRFLMDFGKKNSREMVEYQRTLSSIRMRFSKPGTEASLNNSPSPGGS